MIYYFLCLLLGSVIAFVIIDIAFISNTIRLRKVKSETKKIPCTPNAQIELSSCPFCGQNVENLVAEERMGKTYYSMVCDVQAGGCGCSTGRFEDPKDAILMWNIRPEDFEWLQKIESMEWKL